MATYSSSVVNTTGLPQWVDDKAQGNVATAEQLANRPFPKYTKPRIAGFKPDETLAMDMVRGSMGNWKQPLQTSMDAAGKAATQRFTDADVGAYMSPYMNNVVDASLSRLTQYGDQMRKGIGSRAHNAGAFGDARHGVAEGELNRSLGDTAGQMIAQGNQAAYQDAVRAWGADNTTNLQGANALANMAGAGQKMGLTDIGALMQSGALQRGMDQGNLDIAYQDFMNQFYYPIEGLNLRMSALSNSPYEKTQTQTTTGQQGSSFGQYAGGAAALAGGAAKLYDSGIFDGISDFFGF
jgi:hypothetical protein